MFNSVNAQYFYSVCKVSWLRYYTDHLIGNETNDLELWRLINAAAETAALLTKWVVFEITLSFRDLVILDCMLVTAPLNDCI